MITIGCDPEFLVLGPDNMVKGFNIGHSCPAGNIGTDHGGSVGELRPMYGTPRQVTENIRELFRIIHTKTPRDKIAAGGGEKYGHSIGGHIHFGGVQLDHTYESCTRQRNRGRVRPLTLDRSRTVHKLVYMLDYYLGRRLKKIDGGQRPKSANYGRLSDIESKGTDRFEYRTPPSWLSDPQLTESTLAISYRIAEMWKENPRCFDEIINRNKSIARKKEYGVLIPNSGDQRNYYSEQVAAFKRIAFSKTYRMDNANCLDTWLSGSQIAQIVDRMSKKIALQICQMKLITNQDGIESESVVKVLRFAVPEVKIIAQRFNYHHAFRSRIKDDTIYISKNLRPYLKVKRGHHFRVKFAQFDNNTVVYKTGNSNILNEVITIFETGARKKLRKADANLIPAQS